FDPLRHQGLVVAIGHLAAEGGEEEVGRDENRRRQRDQHARFGAADLEQNEKDQRLFEEIIAERRKELSPKQRRKAARQQQGRRHLGLILCGGPIISMKALCDIHEFGLWTGAPLPAAGWRAPRLAVMSKDPHRIARALSADFTHWFCKIASQD